MIGTILLLIGITTGLIGLIDIFASNEQKKSWSDTVLRLWNWLDEAKQSSYVDLISVLAFSFGLRSLSQSSSSPQCGSVLRTSDSKGSTGLPHCFCLVLYSQPSPLFGFFDLACEREPAP